MSLPWPLRPVLDYARHKRMLMSGLKATSTCSDAMGPVKYALKRAIRGPSREEKAVWSAIDRRWSELAQRTDDLRYIGDSVPPSLKGSTVPLAQQATNGSTTRPWGDLLFQIVRVRKPRSVLELGTCVGFSGSYIASAMKMNDNGHLWTLEGMVDSAKVADETFAALGLSDRVTTIVGRFHDTLDKAIANGPFDIAFVDGHHEGDATIEYYEKIKPAMAGDAIVIFDDIDWSRGMQDAWKHIRSDKAARDHASVMGWGMLIV